MVRPTTLLALALLLASASCSINNTRSLGQDCLQDRECVQGLVCLPDPSSDGRTTCQPAQDGGTVVGSDAQTPDVVTTDVGTDAGADTLDPDAASDDATPAD